MLAGQRIELLVVDTIPYNVTYLPGSLIVVKFTVSLPMVFRRMPTMGFRFQRNLWRERLCEVFIGTGATAASGGFSTGRNLYAPFQSNHTEYNRSAVYRN